MSFLFLCRRKDRKTEEREGARMKNNRLKGNNSIIMKHNARFKSTVRHRNSHRIVTISMEKFIRERRIDKKTSSCHWSKLKKRNHENWSIVESIPSGSGMSSRRKCWKYAHWFICGSTVWVSCRPLSDWYWNQLGAGTYQWLVGSRNWSTDPIVAQWALSRHRLNHLQCNAIGIAPVSRAIRYLMPVILWPWRLWNSPQPQNHCNNSKFSSKITLRSLRQRFQSILLERALKTAISLPFSDWTICADPTMRHLWSLNDVCGGWWSDTLSPNWCDCLPEKNVIISTFMKIKLKEIMKEPWLRIC